MGFENNFHLGKRFLGRHKVDFALSQFDKALQKCPHTARSDLQKILFYTGIALRRVQKGACAYKAWCSALELHRNGNLVNMVARITQPAGFRKTKEKGWNEFYAIQFRKYLHRKRTGRIGTIAEHDMVTDLIYKHWSDINSSGLLLNKNYSERLSLYYAAEIIFPEI